MVVGDFTFGLLRVGVGLLLVLDLRLCGCGFGVLVVFVLTSGLAAYSWCCDSGLFLGYCRFFGGFRFNCMPGILRFWGFGLRDYKCCFSICLLLHLN